MRKLAVILSLVMIAPIAGAASRQRTAGSGVKKNEVHLSGTITEAETGGPARHVQIYNPPDHYQMSDENGHFRIKVAIGQDVTLTFYRPGYELLTTVINISSDSNQVFQLHAIPTTTVRLTDGTTIEAVTDTVEFGYLAPFTGYTKASTLSLCVGGNAVTPDRSQIRWIRPSFQVFDRACCDRGALPTIGFELKDGTQTGGALIDACVGYRSDVILLDHKTGEPAYIPFSDIAEILFP